jgi:hypothetical protein
MDFPLLHRHSDRRWGPPCLLLNEYWDCIPVVMQRNVKLTTHINLVPSFRMSGAIPPIPLFAFMAWITKFRSTTVTSCSVMQTSRRIHSAISKRYKTAVTPWQSARWQNTLYSVLC